MANYSSSPNYSGKDGANTIGFGFDCYIGYGTVTRSGNTVTIPLGLKMIPTGSTNSTWCYNSVGGWYPDTSKRSNLRYAFKTGGSQYCTTKDTLYCRYEDTPSDGTKNTQDNTPWTATQVVSASATSVEITMYATWCQWDLSYTHLDAHAVAKVTRSIPIPAATAPGGSITASVDRTTGSYSGSFSSGNYASISSRSWSISPSATLSDTSGTSGTITGLQPNTTYTLSCKVTNSAGLSTTITKTLTTSGNVPVINSVSVDERRTEVILTPNISYDTNDGFSSYSLQYATSASGASSATVYNTTTMSNLEPNTKYYYRLTVYSSRGRTSTVYTGTVNTTCNLPSELNLWFPSYGVGYIETAWSAIGDTNAPITSYTLYYRTTGDTAYTAVPMGTNTTAEIFELTPDTNYDFYFTATNAAGTRASGDYKHSTTLPEPEFQDVIVSDLLPFSCTIRVEYAMTPLRELQYSFSKDNGTTWSPDQSSNIYYWTELAEETTYEMRVRVKAIHLGQDAQDSYSYLSFTVTTPADQAKMYVKTNGFPSHEGYQPVDSITATKATALMEIGRYHFTDTEIEILMHWNDVNTEQNIGSNLCGYFGVVNGYYTFMGNTTDCKAEAGRVDTIKLTSTYSYTDGRPDMQGNSSYYTVKFYVNGEYITSGTGRSSSAVPTYFMFDLFGCYKKAYSTATIYRVQYGNEKYYPYISITDSTPVFISESGEVYYFDNNDGVTVIKGIAEQWYYGKAYYMLNGQWVRAKKAYIKDHGVWKININQR